MVKTLTQKWRPKTKVIEDKDGNLLTNIDDILTRWKEYCEELYNHEVQKDPEILTRLTKEVTQHQYVEEPPILKDEIIAAIKKLNVKITEQLALLTTQAKYYSIFYYLE